MPATCSFILNKADATYFGGETVSGTIYLTTTNDMKLRDISILLLGECLVKWQETFNNICAYAVDYPIYSEKRENYVESYSLVQGAGNLPAGSHIFKFSIPLPADSPSTFEGKYGRVYYEISLQLNRVFHSNNVFKQPITVIKAIDLNLNPHYKLPMISENTSKLWYWPCSADRIKFKLKIPYAAYAPGQLLKYTLQINNQSNSDILGYKYEFIKNTTFTATFIRTTKRQQRETLAVDYINSKCLRLTNRIFEGSFRVPPTAATTSPKSIICLDYFLRVRVRIGGYHSSCILKMPIIIGTIPITEDLEGNEPAATSMTIEPTLPFRGDSSAIELSMPAETAEPTASL